MAARSLGIWHNLRLPLPANHMKAPRNHMTSTETISFELSQPALQARRNAKWNQYDADILPAFVADMDFSVAAPIQAAIERIVRDRDYGYALRNGEKPDRLVASAFAQRMKSRFGWELSPDLVLPLADLVQGTYAPILAFSDPGDGVVLQTPNYPPFRDAISSTERELLALGRFAIEHDLVVISDEIHSDLVFPGLQHIPFASLGPEIAARTVTLNSATKSFNIPGLRCALMAFGSEDLRHRFHKRIPQRLTGSANIVGVDATVAAWSECQPWLDAVMEHLLEARNRVKDVLAAEVPEIRFHALEATYLAWLDCSKLRLSTPAFQFFLNNARIGFSAGETFDPDCAQFVRFNFATSMPLLDDILDRFVAATRQNDR